MNEFKIGECVIIVYSANGHENFNGFEAVVEEINYMQNDGVSADYGVSINNPLANKFPIWGADAYQLRKLPPPIELGSWEEVESLGWTRPKEIA